MTELVWKCPYCPNEKGWNAPSLSHCGDCGEKQPPAVVLQAAPSWAYEAVPSVAKTRKQPVKRQKGASKQRGKKISYGGELFDSKIEYERFLFLADCQRNGQITGLQVHPTYQLAPSVKLPKTFLPSKTQGAITYTPDFVYKSGGIWVYEDTKGAYGNSKKNKANGKAGKAIVTEAARLRHKLFIAKLASQGDNFLFRIVTVATEPIYQIEALEQRKAA